MNKKNYPKKSHPAWNKGTAKHYYCEVCNKEIYRGNSRCMSHAIQKAKTPEQIRQATLRLLDYTQTNPPYWLGKKRDEATKQKIRETKIKQHIVPPNAWKKGEEHPDYIDGRSKLVSPRRYGDDWDKIRLLIYIRDNFTCQECGVHGMRLDVHHKIPFLSTYDNSLGNLISLCKSCHIKAEKKLNRTELKCSAREYD